jgi:hypothetical protein
MTKSSGLVASRAFVPPCIHWMSPNGLQLSDQPQGAKGRARRNPSCLEKFNSTHDRRTQSGAQLRLSQRLFGE